MCSGVLSDSWLQLYKCTQLSSTLLSSAQRLRIELHMSLNHDRRKQTVGLDLSGGEVLAHVAPPLGTQFSMAHLYHLNYHERELHMERLPH